MLKEYVIDGRCSFTLQSRLLILSLSSPFIVKSCDVPLPLIDLAKMKEPNWDTSMRRVGRAWT